MTVATATSRQDFLGTGSTGPISFPHRLDSGIELQLWTRDSLGQKVAQALFNIDYFVSVAADFSSATVFLSSVYAASVNGVNCSLLRVLPLIQEQDITGAQRYSDGEIEKSFDRALMRVQQLDEKIGDLAFPQEAAESAAASLAEIKLLTEQAKSFVSRFESEDVASLRMRVNRLQWLQYR